MRLPAMGDAGSSPCNVRFCKSSQRRPELYEPDCTVKVSGSTPGETQNYKSSENGYFRYFLSLIGNEGGSKIRNRRNRLKLFLH